MASKKTQEVTVIEIKPVEIASFKVRIRGTSPLISHRFAEKARKEILDKQTGMVKTKKRDPKNPVMDFIQSLYWLTPMPTIDVEGDAKVMMAAAQQAFDEAVQNGARWGFPVTAIKQGAIMAANRNGIELKTTALRGSFFIDGEGHDMCAEVKGSVPTMREDMVRLSGIGNPADIRHRGEFSDWYMDLTIRYNKNGIVSPDQIVNLINLAGFSCGIGEWRPEKDGVYGMYSVVPIE